MAEAFLRSKVGTGAKSIAKAIITLDRPKFTYDGDEHAPVVQTVMLGENQLVDGQDYFAFVTPATTAGTYRASVVGVMNYGGAASVEWQIEKAQGTISVEPQTVQITGAIGTTAKATLNYKGDGEITFGESEYVTIQRSGTELTITSKAAGSGSVTITLEDGQNYKGATAELQVEVSTLPEADPVLKNNSWETIAAYAAMGEADTHWNVGDIKKITLTGGDAGTYGAQIIGFDQDVLDPTDAKYSDAGYNKGSKNAAITFQFVELLNTHRKMHTSNDNSCSWEKSDMRVTTMPLVLSEMPSDVKGVMRIVTKKAPQSTSNKNLISTADKLFLLGPHEVFKSPSNADFTAEGELYTYYASGNSIIKYQLSGSANTWWLRCPATNGAGYFCRVHGGGSSSSAVATGTYGVAAAFCI